MMLKASNVYRKIAIDATDAEGIAPTLPIPTKTLTDTAAQATKGTHSHPTKGKSINSAGRIQVMMLKASNVYRKTAIEETDAEGTAPTLPIPTKTFTDTAAQATKGTH